MSLEWSETLEYADNPTFLSKRGIAIHIPPRRYIITWKIKEGKKTVWTDQKKEQIANLLAIFTDRSKYPEPLHTLDTRVEILTNTETHDIIVNMSTQIRRQMVDNIRARIEETHYPHNTIIHMQNHTYPLMQYATETLAHIIHVIVDPQARHER